MTDLKRWTLAAVTAAVPMAFAATAAAQQAAPAGNAEAARDSVSMCIGCHGIPGYQASFPRVYRVPMIAGQSQKYIESALRSYKRGERNHPTMTAVASALNDQQISDLAAYYAARGVEVK